MPAAEAGNKGCPPGLAKKSVPCVPPGQAKKAYGKHKGYDRYDSHDRYDHSRAPYRRGDIIDHYIVIRDPGRYGLNPYDTYVQAGGYVFQLDRETREVLNLIGAVTAILN